MNQPDSAFCRRTQALLLPDVSGPGPVGAESIGSESFEPWVAAHCRECEDCRTEFERREAMARIVASLPRPPVPEGLASLAAARSRFEARGERALARTEAELGPALRRLRRVPAPAALSDRVLGHRPLTLTWIRRIGAVAAAAVLIVIGLLRAAPDRTPWDKLASGDALAPVIKLVHVDGHDASSLDVRHRAIIGDRLTPWMPSFAVEDRR